MLESGVSKFRTLLGKFPVELKKYLQMNSNTLKDNDLRMLMQEFNLELYILPSEQRRIIDILARDVAQLKKNGVMDYSLLLGIEEL
jgi:hypothetical protein